MLVLAYAQNIEREKSDTHVRIIRLDLGIVTLGNTNPSRFHHVVAPLGEQKGTNDMVRFGVPDQFVGGIPQLFLCVIQIFERDPFVECRLTTGEEMDTSAIGHEPVKCILLGAYIPVNVANAHLL